MQYSLTMSGVLVSVGGLLLVQVGFSEGCANEVITLLPVLAGGVMSWIGRIKAGGVDTLGRKV